jgi:hypothetical protein
MISLYDYLGKPAGKQLGETVNKLAQTKKIPFQTRMIENPKYKGKVMLYPKEFLDEYFNSND